MAWGAKIKAKDFESVRTASAAVKKKIKILEQPANDEVQEETLPPPTETTDQVAWHQFRSRKGWTDETVALVLYEFIQARGLFKELTQFAKGRK